MSAGGLAVRPPPRSSKVLPMDGGRKKRNDREKERERERGGGREGERREGWEERKAAGESGVLFVLSLGNRGHGRARRRAGTARDRAANGARRREEIESW